MGKTLGLVFIGIVIGVAGLYAYQNPEIRSQVSDFVGEILNSASEAPAPAPTHTPTAVLAVALSPTVMPTQVGPVRAIPTSTATPPPTATSEPSPTPTATHVPNPTPIPAAYLVEVISVESLGDQGVDFLLEVRNVGELESEEVAQVEMSVDGGTSELVNIIGALSAGESKSFAFTRTLSPGPHTLRFTVGDAAAVVSVNVESDNAVIYTPTPTSTVTPMPEPIVTPTIVPTPISVATETPIPTNTPIPTRTPVPPTITSTPTPVPPSPTSTPESESLVSRFFKSAKDLTGANDSSQPEIDVEGLETLVHNLINQERVKREMAALQWDEEIAVIARNHSLDMGKEDYFSHVNRDGQNATDRGASAGYDCIKDYGSYYTFGLAENIHQGWLYSSITTINGVDFYNWLSQGDIAARAVNGWMGSQGHRENILKDTYDRTGIGIAVKSEGRVFITQNFC